MLTVVSEESAKTGIRRDKISDIAVFITKGKVEKILCLL